MPEPPRLLVLYGTQTYTAQEIAERLWRTTKALGFRGPVLAMDDYPIQKLIQEEFALFVCATTGDGDEPDSMKRFWKFLLRKNLPGNSLIKLKFGVLGLGDSSYAKFNFAGKKLHKRLVQLGATPLLDIGLCDYQHDLGHEAAMTPWFNQYCKKLQYYFPQINTDNNESKFTPRWKVSLIKDGPDLPKSNITEDIYFAKGIKDHFVDAMLLELEKNVRTTDEKHFQDVRLLTFTTENDTKIEYEPGDVFNIRPRNCKEDIDDLFEILEIHNLDIKAHHRLLVEECYDDMPVPDFLKQSLTLYEIAEQYWNLKFYPTQYVFSLLALVSEDKLERDKCNELSSAQGQEDWLNYSRRTKRTVLEMLRDFHKSTSKLTIEILFELFSPVKPRSFSIASSCLPSGGRKMELLVAVVKYNTKLKKPRLGLGSNWLKGLKPGDKVYGWIKKGTLKFPTDLSTPLILIGPGTGLAPFRSLIQHRTHHNTNPLPIHLFFGCRYREKDFHCREELEKWVDEGRIKLYCAFSRDQEDKIYVQHKIAEHSSTLRPLIQNENAYIFISGNAKNMPDNVRDALGDIIGKGEVKALEEAGRLQVETW